VVEHLKTGELGTYIINIGMHIYIYTLLFRACDVNCYYSQFTQRTKKFEQPQSTRHVVQGYKFIKCRCDTIII
jgi:hypothetical protein